jgi:hypothetical protein
VVVLGAREVIPSTSEHHYDTTISHHNVLAAQPTKRRKNLNKEEKPQHSKGENMHCAKTQGKHEVHHTRTG